MKRNQLSLTIALLFEGLLMLALIWAALVSSPVDFMYSDVAGLSTIRGIGEVAAIAAALCLVVTAFSVAIPDAFQPASRLKRIVQTIPVFLLVVTLISVVAAALQLGATGALLNVGMTQLTLPTTAILVTVLLSTLALTLAALFIPLNSQALKVSLTALGVTIIPSVIAAVAVIGSAVIVSNSQPRSSFGPPNGGSGGGGFPGGGAPGNQGSSTQIAQSGTAAPSTQVPATGGFTPAATPAPSTGGQGGQQGGGQQGGANPPGGNAGRPGGGGGDGDRGGFGSPGGGPGGAGVTSFVGSYTTSGALGGVFALIAAISAVVGWLALRKSNASVAKSAESTTDIAASPAINYSREVGSVLGSFAVIGLVTFMAIQLIPVSRTNPTVQSTVQWDSPQTQQLWENACADCHSNETKWPWYSYVAPSSWLLAVHVQDGRQQFNISELNNMPSFMQSQFPNNARMQIESGSMPPSDYLILHPNARLTDEEKQQLIQGLRNTLGG